MQVENNKIAILQPISLSGLLRTLYTKVTAQKFFRDVGILTFAGVFGAALSVGQGILVARWLQPELFGLAALVMSYPSLVYTFFDARSRDASVKYLSESHTRSERERVLAICKFGYVLDFVIASVAFMVVLFTAQWAAVNIARDPEVANLMVVSAASFIPSALTGTSQAALASFGRFDIIGWTDVLTKVFRVALVLGLVFIGFGVKGVVWGNAIAVMVTGFLQGIIASVLIYRMYGASPLHGRWQALKGQRREMFRFLAYSDLSALIAMIPRELDILVLGYLRGPMEVSYYKLAKSLAGMTEYLAAPLRSVVYPEMAKLWGTGEKNIFRRRVRNLALRIGLPLGLGNLMIIMLMPFVLPALMGSAYRTAIFATQILLIASSLGLALFWLRPFFFVQGRFRHWFLSSGLLTILFAVIYPFIVVRFGYLGAAIWYLTLWISACAVALFFVRRDI